MPCAECATSKRSHEHRKLATVLILRAKTANARLPQHDPADRAVARRDAPAPNRALAARFGKLDPYRIVALGAYTLAKPPASSSLR